MSINKAGDVVGLCGTILNLAAYLLRQVGVEVDVLVGLFDVPQLGYCFGQGDFVSQCFISISC